MTGPPASTRFDVPTFCGRATPLVGLVGRAGAAPPPIAGLPDCNAIVSAGPPLFARPAVESFGSAAEYVPLKGFIVSLIENKIIRSG